MKGHITYKNNKMVAIITLPKDSVTGKYPQKQMSALPFETKQELEIRMNRLIETMYSRDMGAIKKLTLENFLDTWLNTQSERLAQTTQDGYRTYITKHIVPALGNRILSELKPKDFEDYFNNELKIYKLPTVVQQYAIIRKALKYAYKNKMIYDNIALQIERPSQQYVFQPEVYDAIDFIKLLQVVDGTIDEIYIILAGCCGMRAGEIFGLRWSDVNFGRRILFVNNTIVRTSKGLLEKLPKTQKSIRAIPFGEATANILLAWKERQNPASDYVVNQYNSNTWSGHFNHLLKKCKLKQIRFHDLRHFSGTYLLQSGVPIKVISDFLGHSSSQTTNDKYLHVLREMNMITIDAFDTLLKKR